MVFPAPEGRFLRYDNFRRRVWVPAVETSGLVPLKFHSLSHTAAAFMISDGADPLQVKGAWATRTSARPSALYGHLFDDREDDLVAALDRRRSTGLKRKGDQGGTEGAARSYRISTQESGL